MQKRVSHAPRAFAIQLKTLKTLPDIVFSFWVNFPFKQFCPVSLTHPWRELDVYMGTRWSHRGVQIVPALSFRIWQIKSCWRSQNSLNDNQYDFLSE